MAKVTRISGLTVAGAETAALPLYVTDTDLHVDGDVQVRGDLDHDGSNVGFFGKAAAAQQANVADASVAHALDTVFSDTQAEAALNALGTKINSILAALEAYGLMAGA